MFRKAFMELQSYRQCVENKHLFEKFYNSDVRIDGRFVNSFSGIEFEFYWFVDSTWHRLDGPAIVNNSFRWWYFQGNYVSVNSQEEFENWLVGKL